MSVDEATWEDVKEIKDNFPTFNLEDKVVSNGDGFVMRQIKNKELEYAESPRNEWRGPLEDGMVTELQGVRRNNRMRKANIKWRNFVST